MLFNSYSFLFFFPLVTLVYFIIPKKLRRIWLLISSYYFYMCWNVRYIFLILFSTLMTYFCALEIEKKDKKNIKKIWLIICVVSNVSLLFVFKYANFAIGSINRIINFISPNTGIRNIDLLLPVGISFYTFQALGYVIDVYRGMDAEKNIINYALFVSFFPQLVAGPIERSYSLLCQVQNNSGFRFNINRFRGGMLLMGWGYFQKLVIADRASIVVNNVFNHYDNYCTLEILMAVFLFSIQIYCDFAGYTSIARGAASILGFDLIDNFKQPYFSESIIDFWNRWHISLSNWFTEYLYIPLGGNRKGIIRENLNIVVVFLLSGLWHGASWHFVMWGGYMLFFELYQVLRLRRRLIVFSCVSFAWIFFACSSISQTVGLIKHSLMPLSLADVSFDLGLDFANGLVLGGAILLLFIVDILKEKGKDFIEMINSQEFWFRSLIFVMLIWIIILFGVYGENYDSSTFIYFQF